MNNSRNNYLIKLKYMYCIKCNASLPEYAKIIKKTFCSKECEDKYAAELKGPFAHDYKNDVDNMFGKLFK